MYLCVFVATQERIDATVAKARKAVSGSEAIARRLRVEMHDRAQELAERRRSVEDGLEVRTFFDDLPSLRARRAISFCSSGKGQQKRAPPPRPAPGHRYFGDGKAKFPSNGVEFSSALAPL